MTLSTRPTFYSPQLDGLRFIAAMLVFVHHAPEVPFFGYVRTYGWVGVDLFLCISAFLLTRLLCLEYQRSGNLSIRKFFIRRALRIWPLYLFYATFVCLLAVFYFEQNAVRVSGWWLSHITFTNNIMTALHGYPKIPYSAHLWTISLEEQAYLTMPFLLLAYLSSRSSIKGLKLFALTTILVLILARLGFYLNDTPHPFVWVLPLRADAFVLGAAAALLLQNMEVKRPLITLVVGVAMVSSVVLFPSIQKQSLYQVIGYTIVAGGCTLIVVGSQTRRFHQSILSIKPMRYLGKISYGIYIYHLISIAIANAVFEFLGANNNIVLFLTALLITVTISSVSYALLEKPFLKFKKRFSVVSSRPI